MNLSAVRKVPHIGLPKAKRTAVPNGGLFWFASQLLRLDSHSLPLTVRTDPQSVGALQYKP